MVCEKLDQLEWDSIQARAGSLDIDSLGWTDREFLHLPPGVRQPVKRYFAVR